MRNVLTGRKRKSVSSGIDLKQTAVAWKPWLLALLTLLLGLAGAHLVEGFQRDRMVEHERRHVFEQLSQLRARLEGVISGNLLMVHGLSAVIAAQPDIDQAGFARIARGMIGEGRALRNIAGAPDLVIQFMHPVAGNEAAIGLDYRTHPTQRAAALQAVERAETVIAGPLELVQGGLGLVARQPVYLPPDTTDRPRRLWGLVSAVLDVDRLYQLAGVTELTHEAGLTLAIRGRDGSGAEGEVFFGDAALFEDSPIRVAVSLPGGGWQMAASPRNGWQSHLDWDEIAATRAVGLILSVLFALLTYAMARKSMALRRTAAELEESQALFSGFMDNLPAGTFVKDPRAGRTLFENRWLRRHLPNAEHARGVDGEEGLAALRSGPQMLRRELDTPAGTRVICDTLRFRLTDDGPRDLVGGVVMDVTEQVQAERDLAGNRAHLRALLDTIPDLVWMKDPDGAYLACNARFEDFFGAPEEQIIGKRDQDFVSAELADFFRENDLAAVAAGRPTRNEQTVTFAGDGHQELLETINTPVCDAEGKLIGVLGIARDISARREVEAELHANAERLQAAESIAHIGNWEYCVTEGRIRWSDETYRIFGLQPHERTVDYAFLLSQIHPDDRAAHDAYLQRMLESRPGEGFGEQSFRLQRSDGKPLVISVYVKVDYDRDDHPIRLFGTVQDVTERESMNRELHDRLNELTRWQSVILGREDRIQELKQEVNELLGAQGEPPRYKQLREAE